MLVGANQIKNEVGNLNKVTEEISYGMTEMATGAEQMVIAVSNVERLSDDNRLSIGKLFEEIKRFKLQ